MIEAPSPRDRIGAPVLRGEPEGGRPVPILALLSFACLVALGGEAPATEEAKIAVSEVNVIHRVNALGANKGDHYINVTFIAKLAEEIAGNRRVKIEASCKAGERSVSDRMTAFDVRLKTMKAGDTAVAKAPLFIRAGLKDKPTVCDLTFVLHEFGKKTDDTLAKFCYAEEKVVAGACAN